MKSSELVRARQAARGVEPSSSMTKAINVAEEALSSAVKAIEDGKIKANTALIEPAQRALRDLRATGDSAEANILANTLRSLARTFDYDSTNLCSAASLLSDPTKPRMLALR